MQNALRKVINFDFGTGQYPIPPQADEGSAEKGRLGHALILTNDPTSLEWAPRWLEHRGFTVTICADLPATLDELRGEGADVIVVDAALTDRHGKPAWSILGAAGSAPCRVFALCASHRELRDISGADTVEVVYRPYHWDVISQRVARAAESLAIRRELDATREELESARSSVRNAERDLIALHGLDILTRLPTRERFRSLVQRAVGKRAAAGRVGMLVMQLDRFRDVNEVVGHEAGNRLLVQFTERVRQCLQNRTLVGGDNGITVTAALGRLGGVCFGLMMSGAGQPEIERIRSAVLQELERPFEVDGQSIFVTATMGAAFYPDNTTCGDTLLQCAERAVQEAKAAGSLFQIFEKPGSAADCRRLRIEGLLRRALVNDELRLAYQPIMAWNGRSVAAAEALLRWDHPEEGAISPAEFVPIAERTGLMLRIGDFVIRQAVRQLCAWREEGLRQVPIAVNLSLSQLLDGDVAETVARELEANDIDPSLLEFELSERGVLNSRPRVVEQIHRLKELGVRIAIDDFGTGQAAVAYLKDLPVDVVKIDRSYVSGPGRTRRDEAIGSGMVALAKRLNALVIAEGVETGQQLERLREWGCDQFQGFHFSPAMPPEELAEMIRAG